MTLFIIFTSPRLLCVMLHIITATSPSFTGFLDGALIGVTKNFILLFVVARFLMTFSNSLRLKIRFLSISLFSTPLSMLLNPPTTITFS